RMQALNGGTLYDANGNANVSAARQINPSGAPERDIVLFDHSTTPLPGTFGNDNIAGGAGDDVIFGQLGDDVIQGDGSTAINVLATGKSVEAATDGNDYIEGNGGNDLIFGDLGQDDIIGGS